MSFLIILSIALLNIVYLVGFFGISIWLNVAETDYFLGRKAGLVKFRIRYTTFHLGYYIPIVGLSPIYTVVDGQQRMKYPWEFHGHGLVKRLIATYGGVFGLVVAGIVISMVQYYSSTESFISKETVMKYGVYPSEAALESGFLPGDKVIAVNGKDYQKMEDLFTADVVMTPETNYTVLRGGEEVHVVINNMIEKLPRQAPQPFLSLYVPFEISYVRSGSPADQVDIKAGDRITKVNETPVVVTAELARALQADDNGHVTLSVERREGEAPKTFTVNVALDETRTLGILSHDPIEYATVKEHSLGEAVLAGPARVFAMFSANIRAITRIYAPDFAPKRTLGGPVRIQSASESTFWWLTGMYALCYALWNFLPLPKSAFWEFIPLAYEGSTKKKYPYRAFERSTDLSWIVIIAFFAWTFVNDIIKFF